jgi:hypothetical protein
MFVSRNRTDPVQEGGYTRVWDVFSLEVAVGGHFGRKIPGKSETRNNRRSVMIESAVILAVLVGIFLAMPRRP